MVRPVARAPLAFVVLGALLPDLIDKPLYYTFVFATGKRGYEVGLISGTRTFGHTAALLGLVILTAVLSRRRELVGLAWGMASHLFLDNLGDLTAGRDALTDPTTLDGFLFPLRGWSFPISPFRSVRDHLWSVKRAYVVFGELSGLFVLTLLLAVPRLRRRMVL